MMTVTHCYPTKWITKEYLKIKLLLLPLIFILYGSRNVCQAADLAIQIPVSDFQDPKGMYRLDYEPPVGYPKPNTTFLVSEVSNKISFTNGLPGTKYQFNVHYTNDTVHDWLTWTASITTTPDAPTNLSINTKIGKAVHLKWSPPESGGYTKYKVRVSPSSPGVQNEKPKTYIQDEPPLVLRDLVPGASYTVELHTMYENKESTSFLSRNFTIKPNTPGRFIVWYRNETTLLVLWQPPYPPGVFSGYKVQIEPEDATESVKYIVKEGETPGPAQAAFHNLVPGRAYNISVQTVNNDKQTSTPTVAQYRTVPLTPGNITFDKDSITPYAFSLTWLPPQGYSEFDRYQLVAEKIKGSPITVRKDKPLKATFDSNLKPGRTYTVAIKTFSDKVPSWPTRANVTTRPLPVHNLRSNRDYRNGDILLQWDPHQDSQQDKYRITSQEAEGFGGDVNTVTVLKPEFLMSSLSAGRNYSIRIQALSNGIESQEVAIYQATRPSSPIVENLTAIDRGLSISWKSDVTSLQDMYLIQYTRNDTGEKQNSTTVEGHIVIQDLYPGAAYNIELYAVSNGLLSERHQYTQTVFPNPPRNLSALSVTNSSIHIRWQAPFDSLFSSYSLRFRTNANNTWVERILSNAITDYHLTNLTAGEKYIVRVNSISYRTESPQTIQIIQTVRPNGVDSIEPLLDAQNITLQWIRPRGRVEAYDVRWKALEKVNRFPDDTDHGDDNEGPEDLEDYAIDESDLELFMGHKTVKRQVWNDIVAVPISPLMSGVAYDMSIETTSHGIFGDVYNFTIRTLPLITSEIYIVNNINNKSEVTLRYTATPESISLFDRYRFQLSDPSIPPKEVLSNETDRKVTFDSLVPGRLYNFTIWTVSKDVTSHPIVRQDRLYPESISKIRATYVSDRELTLEWNVPPGDYDAFEVQYINAQDRLVDNLTLHPSITITGLSPFRNYTFTVIVRSGSDSDVLRKSNPVSAVFSTKESKPGQVSYFGPIQVYPSNITFEWSLPESEHNGILTSFIIRYGLKGGTLNGSKRFEATDNEGTIIGLQPGVTYTFSIEAYTKMGAGSATFIDKKMPIRAPPRPDSTAKPEEVVKTSSTISIRFRNNYFSNKNGRVQKYTIIVAENKDFEEENEPSNKPFSWAKVQSYNVWPPYQVVEPYNPFEENYVTTFKIGANSSCSKNPGTDDNVYCNGPLRSGRTYNVKIRAYTADDKFSDTEYTTMATDDDNTVLVLIICILIAIVLLFAICMIYIRRNGSGKSFGKRPKKGVNHVDVSVLPDAIIETSRPVKIKDFADHYRLMSADSDFRFSEEFEELKRVGREQACAAADLPCNRPKNRFTNILPYDHSRFKLQPTDDDEGSDYINANYVTGCNSPREFIVTQGPLPSTRDDFWRMCWESNSRAIVMLTRCVEKGREKCDRYWPMDTMPQYYGDIQVQILNESRYHDWIISEFRIQRGDQCRLIKHFHFVTWPDFGVPDPPQILIKFVRTFREKVPIENDRVRPIVVHCSAGVGRSGTFIALDRILQHILKYDFVDIFGIVYSMRKERVWMVQTEQQYICIHHCLLAVLEGKENDIATPLEIHANEGYEDDEGIAESGM